MMSIHSARTNQQGYSLIEVMLTVVILSIGLAGLGLLQVNNVQNTYNANNRALATNAAMDMSSRIRANMQGYGFQAFANIDTGSDNNCTNNSDDDCTPLEMAQDDFNQWNDNIAAILPQGSGIVCTDSTPFDGQPGATACDGTGNNVIKIFWAETATFSDETVADDIDGSTISQVFSLIISP
ncbi:MAG: type IV pilus modification protein PilV [Gammaproteobacteria bacterium]|nr:type IV pilus modification protein PilV [Gammaproteobacteria bacterium]